MSDQNPFTISPILCDCGAKILLMRGDRPLDRVTWRRLQKATAKLGFNLTHKKHCLRCGQEISEEIESSPVSVDSMTEHGDPVERLFVEMNRLTDKAIALDGLRKLSQECDEQRRKLAAQSKVLSDSYASNGPVRDADLCAKRLAAIVAIDA